MTKLSHEETMFKHALGTFVDNLSRLARNRNRSNTQERRTTHTSFIAAAGSEYHTLLDFMKDEARNVTLAQQAHCAELVRQTLTPEKYDLERAAKYMAIALDAARPLAKSDEVSEGPPAVTVAPKPQPFQG